MRLTALALLLTIGMAHAQGVTSSTGTLTQPAATQGSVSSPSSEAAPRPAARRTLVQRFEDANTTHDGHLTAEQARANMPAVARDFALIDTSNHGYVTLQDIKAFNRSKRAARRSAAKAVQSQ